MNKILLHSTAILALSMIAICPNLFSQINEWKTDTLDDGSTVVKYRIYEITDDNDDDITYIEDTVVTIENVSLENCISLLKNVTRHKEFTDDEESRIIKTISADEWIVYYYTDNPWPVANSDCVARMKFSQDTTGKTAVFKLTAEPSMLEKKGVNRMTCYDLTYTFKDLGNGKVEAAIAGKTSPPVSVPMWLIKSAFPDAPADGLKKLISLAKEIENQK